MKRIQKHLFLLVLTLLVLFVSPFTLSGPTDAAAAEPVPGTQTGWVKSGTKIYFYNTYGKKLTGKKKINGKVYLDDATYEKILAYWKIYGVEA